MVLSISIGIRLVENARVAILDCHNCLSRIMCLNFVLKDFRCPSPDIRHPPSTIRYSLFGILCGEKHFLSFSSVTFFVSLMLARLSQQPIINVVSLCHSSSCFPSVANKLDSSPNFPLSPALGKISCQSYSSSFIILYIVILLYLINRLNHFH